VPLLTTSWDDGTATDLALGRLLAERGIRATFYATTGPGGARALEDAGLAELVGLGHELGNHGRTHRPFTELTGRELLEEVRWGRAEMARFGCEAPVVAPPRGHVNGAVLSALRAEGLVVRPAPILGAGSARGLMPTAQVFPHRRGRTVTHLVRRGIRPSAPALVAWCGHRDLFERLRALADLARRRGADLHFWGHSEEVERLDLWKPLDRLLGELLDQGFRPATNGELVAAGAAR
jgi:peptidoglycan/xylan/chitin deacetylase (PgdA/CDA1 family)